MRTALRNNATAYGFSISITAAYGLINGAQTASAAKTIAFAAGAAIAFLVIGLVFVARFPGGTFPEGGQVATFSGGIDLLSITVAVAAALGVSRTPGFFAWPLTALATVVAYLLVGGLDVLLARFFARHTTFGRYQ